MSWCYLLLKVFIKPLLPGLRRGKKNVKANSDGRHQGNTALIMYTAGLMHMQTQESPWQHTQGLHRSKPHGVPVLSREVSTALIHTPEAVSKCQPLHQWSLNQGRQTTLKGSLIAQEEKSNTMNSVVFSIDFLSWIALGIFIHLTCFLLM